jgi:hypothetical protein
MTYRLAAAMLILATSTACSSTPSWREAFGSRDSASAGGTAPERPYVGSAIAATPRAPEMDRNRRIAAQDCSKPVDPLQGNLRCR